MSKRSNKSFLPKTSFHRRIRNKVANRVGIKAVGPGSHPHALDNVNLKYVVYLVLIISIAGLGFIFTSMTKKRNQVDVLSANINSSWSVCLGQQVNLVITETSIDKIDFQGKMIFYNSNNSYKWSPDVRYFDLYCHHLPISKIEKNIRVRLYLDKSNLIKIIEQY